MYISKEFLLGKSEELVPFSNLLCKVFSTKKECYRFVSAGKGYKKPTRSSGFFRLEDYT